MSYVNNMSYVSHMSHANYMSQDMSYVNYMNIL